jgi:hypothetical protein
MFNKAKEIVPDFTGMNENDLRMMLGTALAAGKANDYVIPTQTAQDGTIIDSKEQCYAWPFDACKQPVLFGQTGVNPSDMIVLPRNKDIRQMKVMSLVDFKAAGYVQSSNFPICK